MFAVDDEADDEEQETKGGVMKGNKDFVDSEAREDPCKESAVKDLLSSAS